MKHFGILSGAEIAAAVHRHELYTRYKKGGPLERLLAWRLRDQPRIAISDFDRRYSDRGGRLNPNSYNLRLAPQLLVYRDLPLDMHRDNPTDTIEIPPEGMVLQPGTLFLGKTVEFTATYNLVGVVDGRSSMGRLGFFCHCTAGFIDSGFSGHITLEITVAAPLCVYPGASVAQIRYHSTKPGRAYRGKYNNPEGSLPVASRAYQELRIEKLTATQAIGPATDPASSK